MRLGLTDRWVRSFGSLMVCGALGSFGGLTGCGSDDSSNGGSGASGGAGGAGASGGSGGVGGVGGSAGAGAQGGTAGAGAQGGTAGAGAQGGAAGAGASGGNGGSGAVTSNECFEDIQDGIVVWDYDVQGITTGEHCSGTNHQDIQGIERIVFLGDSIMNGTPPTPANDFVRSRLDRRLKELFPSATSQSCARNGERNGDLMASQIPNCFPEGVRGARTLTIIISGGNDIAALARDKPELAQATAAANGYVDQLRSAVEWLKDSSRFPAGNDVVFSNVYEYTDTSAELSSCPLANLVGLSGTWLNGAAVLTGMNEGYAKIAADTGTDMVFMMETFCGHGYRAGRTDLQCYRGAGAENWFDISCIHPTPTGHNEIFKLFMDVIEN